MDSASSTGTGHVTGGDVLRRAVAVSAASPDSPRRRSSTFSDYSLSEARRGLQDDIFNRGVAETQESHNWASIPLAFALLPALAGIFFNNGSSIITDIMLLGLAAVFLRWSVTQPWTWYHSAQGTRVREERMAEVALEDESEIDDGSTPSPTSSTAEGGSTKPVGDKAASEGVRQARRALNELYVHEVLALMSCFGFPILGAYLLHTIRSELSRPSEGLVSNYNLTIFVLAAEIHPLSHLMKLVRARTLHLQRLVHANPYRVDDAPSISMVQDMARRIEELETRAAAAAQNGHTATATTAKQSRQEAATLVREVRNVIQPDLDALNRAVRRYEKKATVLAFQTESRFASVDMRLHDAIALAAAAAKNSSAGAAGSRWGVLGWLVDRLAWTVTLPFQAVVGMVVLPFRTLSGLFWPQSKSSHDRDQRDRRAGKAALQAAKGRPSPVVDRVPSRLSRR